ncbi:MAG TPA: ATP-binding protein [Candidatus Limnocylindrales bacterium]|nr:ATP-binding protein [Candidatus Limnocylindrales bacterium]
MAPFVDRDDELEALNELWGPRFQLALLWGRRRVGKTRLLDEFAAGKPAITFQADEGTVTEQLARFTERIMAYRDDAGLRAQPLANWDAAIAMILRLSRDAKRDGHPLLLVLDEFPRLVVSAPRLPSLLQAAIEDIRREDLPLFVVLAGSQITLYERHVLHGPLYGRRTWGEQLPPLGYRDAGRFFADWSAADRLRAWALLGGIPYYLEQWEPTRSLEWNIINRLLRKGAVLYEEAELMIKEELAADAATYLSIIAAVAGGATRQSEIADRAGVEPRAVSKYLNQLGRLHMVEHLTPIGSAESSRRGIWRLGDHYLRSWFEFVRANRTDLEARRPAQVFRERVRDRLDQFVSTPAFEDAVRDHALRAVGSDPQYPKRARVGAWWGPVPDERYPGTRRTREGEIELVGYDGQKLVLAGEVKWANQLEDGASLLQLRRTVLHVPGYDPAHTKLALYSREGFTAEFRARAQEEGVILRTVADLFA